MSFGFNFVFFFWYISNYLLHKDLINETINEIAYIYNYTKFYSKLASHSNSVIAIQGCVNIPDNPCRRLKKNTGAGIN